MSLVLQKIEHTIMMKIAEFFRIRDWQIGVYVFDGIMIYKSESNTAALETSTFNECQQYVLDETNYAVKLEEKPMNSGLDLDFKLPRWDLEYAKRLLRAIPEQIWNSGIPDKDAKEWKLLAIAAKNIGISAEEFLQSLAHQICPQVQTSHTLVNCLLLWSDSNANMAESGWNILERHSALLSTHNLRPIMDLECPYGIDDLLQAKTLDRVRYIAPKVLALITGDSKNSWYKKVTSNNGETQTVNFVPMSNGLCSLSDIYVEISTTVTQQGSDGQQTEKSKPNWKL